MAAGHQDIHQLPAKESVSSGDKHSRACNVGHAAIEALWKSWIDAGIRNLTLKATDLEISGDLAYEVGDLALQMPAKDGSPSQAAGTYLFVWKRGGDGVWRIKVDTWNGPVTAEEK